MHYLLMMFPDCAFGSWGANGCENRCHCLNDNVCDRNDGYCSVGCAAPYVGPGCSVSKCAVFLQGPKCLVSHRNLQCKTTSRAILSYPFVAINVIHIKTPCPLY